MKAKPRFSNFNDGYLTVYREKEKTTDFSAKENVSSLDDLTKVMKLAYEEKSNRIQDYEFADKMGFSLSIKVKTRLFDGVDNKCKTIINNYLYDVSYIDYDRINQEMYLYLEGVRSLA